MHVLSCFVQLKSVLLISCVFCIVLHGIFLSMSILCVGVIYSNCQCKAIIDAAWLVPWLSSCHFHSHHRLDCTGIYSLHHCYQGVPLRWRSENCYKTHAQTYTPPPPHTHICTHTVYITITHFVVLPWHRLIVFRDISKLSMA